MKTAHSPPVIGFAAYSGSGKTTLLIKLLSLFRARRLRVGVIKHAHHDFEIDYPGKDSYELRHAGASQMLIGSRQRWALIVETEAASEPTLDDYLLHLDRKTLDLILVEGFKPGDIPKIEIHRPALGKPLLCETDPGIIAVATDALIELPRSLPQLDLNAPGEIADFIVDRFRQSADNTSLLQQD